MPLVVAVPHDQSQVQRISEVCHRADCSARRWHVGSNAVAEIIAASLIPPGLEMRHRPPTRAVEADGTSEEVASASTSRKEHSFY